MSTLEYAEIRKCLSVKVNKLYLNQVTVDYDNNKVYFLPAIVDAKNYKNIKTDKSIH